MTDKECHECQNNQCAYKICGKTGVGKCYGYMPKKVTNLDWLKAPERTAEEIVDFFSQACTSQAKTMYCDQFESCRDCKISWLLAKKEE